MLVLCRQSQDCEFRSAAVLLYLKNDDNLPWPPTVSGYLSAFSPHTRGDGGAQ